MIRNLLFTIIILAFLGSCSSGKSDQDTNNADSVVSTKPDGTVEDQNKATDNAYEYSKVLKLQDSALADFSWPRKLELDLNDDSKNEEFLAIEGYLRGSDYVLFTKVGQNWFLISGTETIPSGHLEVKKLDNVNNGWHDFVANQPSNRDGIIESYFTWDGHKYILKDQKEVQY